MHQGSSSQWIRECERIYQLHVPQLQWECQLCCCKAVSHCKEKGNEFGGSFAWNAAGFVKLTAGWVPCPLSLAWEKMRGPLTMARPKEQIQMQQNNQNNQTRQGSRFHGLDVLREPLMLSQLGSGSRSCFLWRRCRLLRQFCHIEKVQRFYWQSIHHFRCPLCRGCGPVELWVLRVGVGWHGEPGANLDSHRLFKKHDSKLLKKLHGFVVVQICLGNTWWRMIIERCSLLPCPWCLWSCLLAPSWYQWRVLWGATSCESYTFMKCWTLRSSERPIL